MWRHYVYFHRRLDTGVIFYIGKGSARLKDKCQIFERAFAIHKNPYWLHIYNKTKIQIEIIASCKTDLEAQKLEKELIAFVGRKNLANLTNGGDGSCGIIPSVETLRKRSIASSGPRSQAFIDTIRIARKNGGNGGVVKKGDKLPESWRANLAKGKLGNKNPWFGKSSPAAKLVLNLENGIYYDTIEQAALAYNINPKTLYQYLDGSRINKTSLARV